MPDRTNEDLTPTGWNGVVNVWHTSESAAAGPQWVNLDGGTLSQTIRATGLGGSTLTLTFRYVGFFAPLTVQLGPESRTLTTETNNYATGTVAWLLPPVSPASVTVTFSGGSGAYLDAVSLTAPTCASNVEPVLSTVSPLALQTPEDTAKPFNIVATDDDGDVLTYAVASSPTNGTVTPASNATGAFTYTPSANVSGSDSFTVTVSDGLVTKTVTVNVTIDAVDDPPIIDPASVSADIVVDAEGPSGTVVTFTTPTATDVELGGSVPVTCDEESGSTFPIGTTPVTCTASDGTGGTTAVTFTITVQETRGPAITWVGGPQPNQTYTQASLPAAPTCTAVGVNSLAIQCRVYSYSTAPGTHTLTARARDANGNSSVSTRTYTVTASAPTATPRPPTATPRPATATPRPTTVPPTATPTRPARPTATPVMPPTATAVPPTASPVTPVAQPTGTPTRPPRR